MKQTSTRSHLRKQMEEQTKHTIVVSTIGSILIIAGLIFLGPKVLSSMSLLVQSNNDSSTKSQTDVIVTSPILDPLPISTNSAQMIVSGQAQKNRKIKLFVNDTNMGEKDTDSDGSFRFTNVKLSDGENVVKATSLAGDKESNSSRTQTVRYMSKAPTLTVDSPTDNQEIHGGDKKVSISGKTDSGIQVTINGVYALSKPDGSFSFTLAISDGDNTITIVASDDAGNQTQIVRHVKYSS